MDKNLITNMNEMCMTKKMLAKLRENRAMQAKKAADQFVKILTEEDEGHKDYFVVKKDTPQFGDIRTNQEETIKKTINDNIKLESDALRYYPDSDDLTLDGKIPPLNLKFQFRYSDPSGTDGLYVWTEALQLTEANTRTIGKLRNAFMNWRDSITQDAGLMEKLKQAAQKENQ